MKDVILVELLSADAPSFTIDYKNSEQDYGFSSTYVNLILDQFVELGLIEMTKFIGTSALIHIKAKAMDLFQHGGFTVEEELLKGNIEKLGMELDLLAKQLTPKYTERASQVASIASAVMQGLTLFK